MADIVSTVRKLKAGAALVCVLAAACSSSDLRVEPDTQPGNLHTLPEAPADISIQDEDPNTPLVIDIDEAILLALRNNQSFAVAAVDRQIRRTFETEADAVFDPTLYAELSARRERSQTPGTGTSTTERYSGTAGINKTFPTGTSVGIEAGMSRTESSRSDDPLHASRLGLTVTQSILQGFGTEVNLARIRQARLDTLRSQYELQGFAEALVAQVEKTCWDYWLALRQIEIFEESLRLAERQLDEIRQRIEVGALAETELAAAQAEVALRLEALINARSTLSKTRLTLLRLLNPNGNINWQREITLAVQADPPADELDDVEVHAAIALDRRPELNQAKLSIDRNELELVRTRNGLLPRLDLFISLGQTGYSQSFADTPSDREGSGYDVSAGVRFDFPIGNRSAEARHRRAGLTQEQSVLALGNLEQLIQVEVRSAHVEVNRTGEQISATAATRRHQEEKLRAETEKFRVGRSTSLLVASAQRDLVASRIAEVQAIVNHIKAIIDLYRFEGTLLDRRGIGRIEG